MKHGVLWGVIATVAAFTMSFSAPVQSAELPQCNASTLWTVAETLVTDQNGTLWSLYLCMPDGWQLVGVAYCSADGNCSSN
jgi:hypothetical protein